MRGIKLLVMLVFCAALSGSDLASVSSGDIRFGIDTALFNFAGAETMGLEIYEHLDLDQFSSDQDSIVEFTTTLAMISESGDTTAFDQWNSEAIWAPGRSAVNSIVLPVIPGNYCLVVTVTDAGNGKEGVVTRDLTVRDIGTLSEIELARAVVPSPDESTNPLRKGEVLVYPAADGSFTLPEEHMVYYYIEIYNNGGSSVQLQGRLETSSGETIFARPWVSLEMPEGAEAVGLVDSLDLHAVRNSGLHRVVFSLVAQNDTLETDKYLIVGRNMESEDDFISESVGELDEIPYPDHFRLILSSTEASIYDSLDEDARKRFYSAYWQWAPEQRGLFEERCEESNQYTSVQRESWRTDRGRVYVIYGPPDDIESVLLQGRQVPHEIWYYYVGGNESFVFADRNGTGNYEQVYSSVEGEVSYTNWESMISPVSSRPAGE
ncbi:MAG: GWxTD domain-containing protein [Candidatus Aegiribacteria sp.]|nr:GWxTD domain-containing protein [Candidatus Aegiribacteria sp.]